MGFQIDDAIFFLIIKNNYIKKNIDLFTLGKPTSHVVASELRHVLNSKNLIKLGLENLELDNFKKMSLLKMQHNEIVDFFFFTKLLKFNSYKSIDINKSEKPDYVLDVVKNIPRSLKNKADFVYDTGSLGYTKNPFLSLNFLNFLLKKEGVIYHKNPHNNYINTGYYQINRTTYYSFYKNYVEDFYDVFFCGTSIRYLNKVIISNCKNLYKYNLKTNIIFIAFKGRLSRKKKLNMFLEINLSFPLFFIFLRKINILLKKIKLV